jgi:hypothetical protein
MYTAVTARRAGAARAGGAGLHGHIYDISEHGVRIELDEPLEPGENVALRLCLPGAQSELKAWGNVIWVNDVEDDPGPRRMALRFIDFPTLSDLERLISYLTGANVRHAA